MTIDALLLRAYLQEVVHVVDLRLVDQPFDRDGPGSCDEALRSVCDATLIGREFVEVVVVGDVLKRGRLLAGRKAAGSRLFRRRLNDIRELDARTRLRRRR